MKYLVSMSTFGDNSAVKMSLARASRFANEACYQVCYLVSIAQSISNAIYFYKVFNISSYIMATQA